MAIAGVIGGTALVAAAGQFDGSYSGPRTTTRGGPPYCAAAPQRISISVSNGQLSFSYNGIVSIPATVAADGSFSGSAQYQYGKELGFAKLSGRIASNVLNADTEGKACSYHYSLNKA
jgi:hypothetical protein